MSNASTLLAKGSVMYARPASGVTAIASIPFRTSVSVVNMSGGGLVGSTVNATGGLVTAPTVTVSGPVVAEFGTVVTSDAVLADSTGETVPLNDTVLALG